MTRVIHAVAAALIVSGAALGITGAVLAQTSTTTTTTSGPAGSVSSTTVTTEQQAKIKAYVTKEKVRSVTAPSGFTVSTGATLPADVELQTLPADVGVTGYRYTVIGDRTVLVDPGTRRIVQVIQ